MEGTRELPDVSVMGTPPSAPHHVPSRPITEGVRCEPMNLETTTLLCTAANVHGPRVGGRPGWLCGLGGSGQSVVAEGEAERQTKHVARVPCHRTDGTPSKPVLEGGVLVSDTQIIER